MSALSQLPMYIYKILPNSSPYTGTPIPIPSSWEFPKTQTDLDDGFVHLSTLHQLPSTLTRFYSAKEDLEKGVQVLKVDYGRLSVWKIVKWEKSRSNGESYPHLYGMLTGEFIRDLRLVKRAEEKGDEKGESWEDVVERLKSEGWLED
ncbi:hypothetical protein ACEPAI_2762 [Sanghuangporus weigelae]